MCGQTFAAMGRAVYCSQACRQRAFRLRHLRDREVLQMEATKPLRRRAGLVEQTIYECPNCEAHYLGERRCPDCNLMCRRLGLGGACPHCDEPVLVSDLLAGVEL